MGDKHLQNYLFFNANESGYSKSCDIFLVYDLPACNKKGEILQSATALIADLRNQFNHVFSK